MPEPYLRPTFPEDTPLSEIRTWIRDNWLLGVICPACDQLVRVYRRSINAQTARIHCRIYDTHRKRWCDVPNLLLREQIRRSDETKLAYWGLLIARPHPKLLGQHQRGWWGVSDKGEDWVRRQCTIPKYAYVCNDIVLAYKGPEITIDDALASGPFRLEDLIALDFPGLGTGM